MNDYERPKVLATYPEEELVEELNLSDHCCRSIGPKNAPLIILNQGRGGDSTQAL